MQADGTGSPDAPDRYLFTEDGGFRNAQLQTWFEGTIDAFMSLVEANKHYPCIKAAWIEFLGEQPDPTVTRVQ